MERKTVERISLRRTTARAASWLTGGIAVAVALMMALSPAAASHVNSVLKAPYLKSSLSDSDTATASYCASASIPKTPVWNGTSGVFKTSSRSSASSCTGYAGLTHPMSEGLTNTLDEVAVPLKLGSSVTSVEAIWTLKVAGAISIKYSGTCPAVYWVWSANGTGSSACTTLAESIVEIISQVVDATNGTTFSWAQNFYSTGAVSYYTAYENCYNYTCSSNSSSYGPVSQSFSNTYNVMSWDNGTVNASHSYYLVTEIFAYTLSLSGWSYTPILQPGGTWASKASATINLGNGGGTGATLNSVHLT